MFFRTRSESLPIHREYALHYQFKDLINTSRIQDLIDNFCGALGIAGAIIDLKGNILLRSNWLEICSVFHRHHPQTRQKCVESDTILANRLLKGQPHAIYQCRNGIYDAAAPIVVEGEHVANVFVGQFFLRPLTDAGIDGFRAQAFACGFDERAYLAALADVPVISEERLDPILRYLVKFAEQLAEMGIAHMQELQAVEALKNSEKRFSDLVENSLTGIAIVQDDRIVYQNPEQERISGPLLESLVFPYFMNLHPDDVARVVNNYRRLVSGRDQTLEEEIRFYPLLPQNGRSDMKWVYCRASKIEYRGRDALLLSTMDISRAKALEKLVRIQDKMSSLGRVAAGIAHEVRNPLSGINLYVNTLARIYDQPGSGAKVHKIIDQIQSASRKIETVIKRVMDFSRPSELKCRLIHVHQPIEEALGLASVTLRRSGIRIEKRLAANLPECYADAPLIEEVVLNLITNAAEAMRAADGPKRIEITSGLDTDRITITVADSGPGIAADLRDNIFDPFYSTKYDGTGIGLSISHRIISDHGGSLTVSSSRWGGAEFKIELPMDRKGALQ